jgi:hypothetical protein
MKGCAPHRILIWNPLLSTFTLYSQAWHPVRNAHTYVLGTGTFNSLW